ncbi:DUF4232 domain-containing protein [Streptomyces sp. NPDC003042]
MTGTKRGTGAALAAAALLLTGALTGTAAAADAAQAPPSAPAPACKADQLIADSAERVGSNRVRITVINDGPKPCVLKGFPSVALAGQGSPGNNKPLKVSRQGDSRPVTLAVGGRASTQLTFTPVLGEADGFCASGATPSVAPSIVLGVGGGGLQLAPADGGNFALCDDKVRATAFRSARS